MRTWAFVGAASLVLAFVSGCSSPPALPDRVDPLVKTEEARLATILGADQSILGVPGVCAVRLLGQQTGASFVWATCEAPEAPHTAASLPLRVDGTKVTKAQDGAGFSESLRQMFPKDLADFVLDHQDSPELQP